MYGKAISSISRYETKRQSAAQKKHLPYDNNDEITTIFNNKVVASNDNLAVHAATSQNSAVVSGSNLAKSGKIGVQTGSAGPQSNVAEKAGNIGAQFENTGILSGSQEFSSEKGGALSGNIGDASTNSSNGESSRFSVTKNGPGLQQTGVIVDSNPLNPQNENDSGKSQSILTIRFAKVDCCQKLY